MSRPQPRLILVRHGETDWTITGQHTGRSDIPLTMHGEKVVKDGAWRLVGDGLIIDPKSCLRAIVSPRQRASKTFHLAFAHTEEPPHEISEDVREWDYGDYDGLTLTEIHNIDGTWNVWKDGCPGGESVEAMEKRVDSVIAKVRGWHQEYLENSTLDKPDVLIFAHGHFGRVLVTRWLGYPLADGRRFTLGTASISVLGYGRDGGQVLQVLNEQF
ncbi:hypothetical protein APHAL10511_006120 [Amanita phalloides]|nr:hypothetical protein APHAL10511_006120 [Amanita phalloides]